VELLVFHLEIAALSAILVLLYAARGRLGLAPIYMAVGVLMGFALIGSRLQVAVPVVGGGHVRYASAGYLPLMLGTIALVYTLEGTREARRMVLAFVAVKVLVNLLKSLLSLRIASDPARIDQFARGPWTRIGLQSSFVSTVAILGAALVTVIVYQWLLNRARTMPTVVALTAAMVAAMLTDGVLYAGLLGRIGKLDAHFASKFTAGFAVAVPMALYITWQLRRAPDNVKAGIFERGAFELVDLRRQLSSMRQLLSAQQAQFENLKTMFGRYVAPDVVQELIDEPSQLELGGEVREVTILFTDIRGYSTLSEAMNPQQIIELLNRYFGAMSKHLDVERGTIIEFEGDAILAVFGAPLSQPDHAQRAVRAATAMLDEVDALNREFDADGTAEAWQALGIDEFRMRVGIHSGTVVVGNVGSETRSKYAVIGDTVNTAARVEQLNKRLSTWILLTDATASRLGGDDRLRDMGTHDVRGRKEPVHVYTIGDSGPVRSGLAEQPQSA